jgi:hypothetical protein
MTESPERRSVVRIVDVATVDLHPRLDILGQPDLALGEIGDGLGEVGAARDLVSPLATDPTQADADLVRTHQTDLLRCHEITVGAGLLVFYQLHRRQLVASQLG